MHEATLQLIRDALLDDRLILSRHAIRELAADRLLAVDAESAILTGVIRRSEPDEVENPGPRYTVEGIATDTHTRVAIVCRFVVENNRSFVLVITCYEIKP